MATTQYTTFWNFLKKQKIEVPIIQRDYAQGRKGKEKLREKFLDELKVALDMHNKKLKLDFVYGSIEDNKLQPLDGQQRLTTLWLLHWYIAFKAGKLIETKEIFKNFTYETRTSSREFCSRLSEFSEAASGKIVEHIQNQTWFFSAWKQDPTIQAMLNMLGGTDVKEDDGDIIDGIEELFSELPKEEFDKYWEILTEENCPIIFYYMPLNELKLSDDLYIKMNARGKPLTSFENFKADLIGYMKKKKDANGENNGWKDIDITNFEKKLDTTWTDIFWEFKSPEHKIDEIYFAFFNRYFVNNLITAKKTDKTDLLTQKEIEEHRAFKYLYGNQSDDSSIKYSSFDFYKVKINENELFDKNVFESLTKLLDNFSNAFKSKNKDEINKLFYPNWDEYKSNFKFIPEYKNDNDTVTISTLTQSQRVVFHAICCYFVKNKYDETSFKRWMRVVWNIVENANVNTIQSMVGTIRLIDELKEHSSKIYEFLSNPEKEIKSDTVKEQVEEEREKAKIIIKDANWEEKIIEAEKWAFFNGAIRFLFRVGEKEYNWQKFDNRFKKSKQYFKKEGVIEDYSQKAILLRSLISKFAEFNHFKDISYDNNASSWKRILLQDKNVINRFFNTEDIIGFDYSTFNSEISDVKLQFLQNDLVKTELLNKIPSDCTFHWWNYGGYYSLYPYNTKSQTKIFVLANERNDVLSKLEKEGIIEVDGWQRIDDLPYFKGWEIIFKLNDKKYKWWGTLYELNEKGEWENCPKVDLSNLKSFLLAKTKSLNNP